MQNKGFIRVIAVLLTLICLFYISFSVVTAVYNNKAKEYAAGDEAKYKHYIDSISTEKVYWWYYTYQQCREMEIGLGLDLKGGMNVMLQISVADVLKSLSNNNPDPNFNAAMRLLLPHRLHKPGTTILSLRSTTNTEKSIPMCASRLSSAPSS